MTQWSSRTNVLQLDIHSYYGMAWIYGPTFYQGVQSTGIHIYIIGTILISSSAPAPAGAGSPVSLMLTTPICSFSPLPGFPFRRVQSTSMERYIVVHALGFILHVVLFFSCMTPIRMDPYTVKSMELESLSSRPFLACTHRGVIYDGYWQDFSKFFSFFRPLTCNVLS